MQKYKMPISRLRMMVCLIGMLLPMCMFAQQITVQGVVKDQTGETVIGASVMEKGTTNGTITGIDGDFSLNMSPNGTLVWGIERSVFFNGREKWAKGFENQRV